MAALGRIFEERKNLAHALKDTKSVVGALELALGVVIHIVSRADAGRGEVARPACGSGACYARSTISSTVLHPPHTLDIQFHLFDHI